MRDVPLADSANRKQAVQLCSSYNLACLAKRTLTDLPFHNHVFRRILPKASIMFATRRFVSLAPRAFGAARGFQSTARAAVQVGDSIPTNIDLVETSPGNKVNIAKELQGKGVIIGVPAAFSTLPNVPATMVHHRVPAVPVADD